MPESRTAFCTQCGEKLAADARFCSSCGASVRRGPGEVEHRGGNGLSRGRGVDLPEGAVEVEVRGVPLVIGGKTDIGRTRRANEDAAGWFLTEDLSWLLLVVCDGLGGHAGGKTASNMAIHTITRSFGLEIAQRAPVQVLRRALEESNRAIHARADKDDTLLRMGTTAAALATDGDRVYLAHVGDSRVYRIRGNLMEQLTRDHSTVQQMVDRGLMTDEEARNHPRANLLARCLGPDSLVEVEVRGPLRLEAGDRYLLCSDGLYSMVEESTIAALATMYPVEEAVDKLVSLANDRGGEDNITVQILHRIDGAPPSGVFDADRFRVISPPAARGVATGRQARFSGGAPSGGTDAGREGGHGHSPGPGAATPVHSPEPEGDTGEASASHDTPVAEPAGGRPARWLFLLIVLGLLAWAFFSY